MALALLLEDDSVIYLDAVTNFSKSRRSSVSSHTVDASSKISDHVSKDNPQFSIRAVVSSADFHTPSTRSPEILEEEDVDNEYNRPSEEALIRDNSSLLDILPGSVQQFLTSQESSVELQDFRGYSHQAARDRLERMWDDSEIISILDYDYDYQLGRTVNTRLLENCTMTSFDDVEEPESGDALTFSATFEQIRFVYVKEVDVEIARQPSSEVSDSASSEENRGDQSGSSAESESNSRLVDYAGSELLRLGGAIRDFDVGGF